MLIYSEGDFKRKEKWIKIISSKETKFYSVIWRKH